MTIPHEADGCILQSEQVPEGNKKRGHAGWVQTGTVIPAKLASTLAPSWNSWQLGRGDSERLFLTDPSPHASTDVLLDVEVPRRKIFRQR